MKIIFLDIDGVLNTTSREDCPKPLMPFFTNWGYGLAPKRIERLAAIVKATGASIVVSSTWRLYVPMDDLEVFLRAFGCEADIIGKTPHLGLNPRGDEVQAWLDEHQESLGVDKFVILDDRDDFPGLEDHLVKTDEAEGLTWKNADSAVRILGARL